MAFSTRKTPINKGGNPGATVTRRGGETGNTDKPNASFLLATQAAVQSRKTTRQASSAKNSYSPLPTTNSAKPTKQAGGMPIVSGFTLALPETIHAGKSAAKPTRTLLIEPLMNGTGGTTILIRSLTNTSMTISVRYTRRK